MQVLKSGLFEIMKQPPFPGMYKTKDTEDLDTVRMAFHLKQGQDPISIMRFLDFLADIARQAMPTGRNHDHGEEQGQGGYGYDAD
jgi:hypothetical protein